MEEKSIIEKLSIGKKINKILPYNMNNIKVYAFVGPSGTGKSYRAQQIAYEHELESIIDDGLLIKGTRVIAGVSAKRAKTKVQTVKAALFSTSEEQERIISGFKKEKIKSVLILGTSDEMVQKIQENLRLPKISEIIYIREVATEAEMKKAVEIRRTQGKHIVPVPTFEIKKDFSGILLDPLQIFKHKKNVKVGTHDRSIIRPKFSYLGRFTIKDKAFRDLIHIITESYEGIYDVTKIYIDKPEETELIYLSLDIVICYGFNIIDTITSLKEEIREEIEKTTAVNVSDIDIKVVNIETDKDKLKQKKSRYTKRIKILKEKELL